MTSNIKFDKNLSNGSRITQHKNNFFNYFENHLLMEKV